MHSVGQQPSLEHAVHVRLIAQLLQDDGFIAGAGLHGCGRAISSPKALLHKLCCSNHLRCGSGRVASRILDRIRVCTIVCSSAQQKTPSWTHLGQLRRKSSGY
jgi:hypothetical protein